MPKHVQFLPVFLPLAVLHLACSDDPKPQTIKTEIYSPLLAGFCEDEAHVKSPESEFTSCASGHWGENEFFVRFNEPRADFPWLASVSPDPGNGKLTMEDVAVLQDANDVLLEGFGVSLAELDRAVVPTVLEVPGVEGKIFHSYVEHFNHRVDERRVKGDKIFISRSPTGSVRSMLFRWTKGAANELMSRTTEEIAAAAEMQSASLAVAQERAAQLGENATVELQDVWVPTPTGIVPAVQMRWNVPDSDEVDGMMTEDLFLNGRSLREQLPPPGIE